MKLSLLKPSKSLNPAYFKQSLKREQIELFKSELQKVFNHIDENQDEEYHKNLICQFLRDVYYKDKYLINVNGKQDLAIRVGNKTDDAIGVILEFKKPTEKNDMVSANNANVKALQELILYYLRETVGNDKHKIKYLIATNIWEWFIFDEIWFEKNIFLNTKLVNDYNSWKVSGHDTKHFYKLIAAKYLDSIIDDLPCTYFNLKEYKKIITNPNSEDDKLIDLYKILSPEHLLKERFINDSNTLNKEFYNELLHIIGLEEIKDNGKKIIQRKSEQDRDDGSLLENTINKLKTNNKLVSFEGLNEFGETEDEKLFSIALELCITWLDRILFLKLLEGQLIKYHKDKNEYAFLDNKRIKDFDEIDELFFEVLAIAIKDRTKSVNQKFGTIPYLNSSLFEISELESKTIQIADLKDRLDIPIYGTTVLKDAKGSRIRGSENTLHYLFDFLDAFDFASDNSVKIQEENKNIINASVLGLIFEKINGYKEGSFFTPGFVTMYMCHEAIRKAVLQKFNDTKNWDCKDFAELKDKIDYPNKEQRQQANEIINSIKICDPAVGSGHFLVSALNELIAIKSELCILNYRDGSRVKGLKIKIANDELIIISEENDKLFEYTLNQNNKPIDNLQQLQESLFHEKQTIIENCLFGVDINPKSVMICRLRLWIELLKNSYYTKESNYEHLETLPNIDINIKCGNSLISRFSFKDDPFSVLKGHREALKDLTNKYKVLVYGYKNAIDKKAKDDFRRQIKNVKKGFEKFTLSNDKEYIELKKKEAELMQIVMVFDQKEKDRLNKLNEEVTELKSKYAQKLSTQYGNAFEWRFEFPEILDEDGQLIGFDVIIGNPPYIQLQKMTKDADFLKEVGYESFERTGDIYCLFYEFGFKILKPNGILTYITSNKWMRANYGEALRKYFISSTNILQLIDFAGFQVFESATVDTNILLAQNASFQNQIYTCALGKNWNSLNNLSDYFRQNSIELRNLKSESSWAVLSPEAAKIKTKVEMQGLPLKEWGININYGIKTGLNEAFIIDGKTKEALIQKSPKSAEIIRPILRGRDIQKYYADFADLWLLFIPWHFPLHEDKNIVGSSKMAELEFQKQFPEVYLHLSKYKKELSDRNKAETNIRYEWYALQRYGANYWQEFFKPKIIYPNMTKYMPFVYDKGSFFINDKCFMITGEHLDYLTAFLNSKLFKFCYRNNFPELLGGTRELRKVFFDYVSVKKIDDETNLFFKKLIDGLISTKKEGENTFKLEAKIDEAIFDLYELTESEKDLLNTSIT